MDKYLLTFGPAIILTKPGLLSETGAVDGGEVVSAPPPTVAGSTEDLTPSAPSVADRGDSTFRFDRADDQPEWEDGTRARYRVGEGTWADATVSGAGGRQLTVTAPPSALGAEAQTLEVMLFGPTGGTNPIDANYKARFTVQAPAAAPADDSPVEAVPEAATPDPSEADIRRGRMRAPADATADGRAMATARRDLEGWHTGIQREMHTGFLMPVSTGDPIDYWPTGTNFTEDNVGDLRTTLRGDLDALRTQRDGFTDATGTEERARVLSNIAWLEDREERADALHNPNGVTGESVADRYAEATTDLNGGNFTTANNFLQEFGTERESLRGRTWTQAALNPRQQVGDLPEADDTVSAPRSGGGRGGRGGDGDGGRVGAQGAGGPSGWQQGVQGVHDALDIAERGAGLGMGLASAGMGLRASGGGVSYSSGGLGGLGGLGGGGFGLMGFGGINNQREEERAIKAMINQLMMSIAMGNLDAISTALIMIARQGKNTLIKAAFSMTMALQSQEQQQEVITDQMGQLAGTETNYASSLQTLNSDMGRLSNNRQMLVNLLRDVKSMSDELDNMAKSWQDVELQQGRRQMVFTA